MPKSMPDSSLARALQKASYSKKAIEELWKWYDYKEKKGVANY
jgi:hypothetical protein